ncbi:Outer membrane efflux protein [compost metagenome]
MKLKFIALTGLLGLSQIALAQVLPLSNALDRSVQNYQTIKAKEAMAKAAEENIQFQKYQDVPDITFQAQQNYGTINAQNGPLYSYGGLGAASTSMPLAEQNWNAAFGSLYLANVNWNLFSFGRIKNQVAVAESEHQTATRDLDQELFQHKIKVTAAYLNLLASQRIKFVQEKNMERAKVFLSTTVSRAQSGLIPEVDASLAKAEVSNAQSAQIKAYDKELDYSKNLAVLLGDSFQTYVLDSVFTTKTPLVLSDHQTEADKHPYLLYQKSKIEQSQSNEKYVKTNMLPSLMAFGVLQGRGSGFEWNYVQDNNAYSNSYWKGAQISRGNYLIGLTLSWNITNAFRYSTKAKEQKFQTSALQNNYDLLKEDLSAQALLASAKYANAVKDLDESNIQVKAASDAYRQHMALYTNGLTTIVDLTQSHYLLNRAEIDHEIAQNNVWQALLLKAAAQGDLTVILNAIPNK